MLLLTPNEASAAIGIQCAGAAPATDSDSLMAALLGLTSRLEGICEVDSLERTEVKDIFSVTSPGENAFQLRNAFIIEDGISSVLDPYGTGLDVSLLNIDYNYGIVRLDTGGYLGKYAVQYESGFAAPAADDEPDDFDKRYRIAVGVPQWMKDICHLVMLNWFRSLGSKVRVPKDVSLYALNQVLTREMYARIYNSYMRPRVGMQFVSQRLSV